jgi:hypothetical protein
MEMIDVMVSLLNLLEIDFVKTSAQPTNPSASEEQPLDD